MGFGGSEQGLVFEGAGSVFVPLVCYAGARAEEATPPPLRSPPLPCCRYPWWTPSWKTTGPTSGASYVAAAVLPSRFLHIAMHPRMPFFGLVLDVVCLFLCPLPSYRKRVMRALQGASAWGVALGLR